MTSSVIKGLRISIAVIIAGLFFYYVFPHLFIWFLPFLIAYLIMTIANPLIVFVERKFKINRKIGSVIVVTLLLVVLGGVLAFIFTKLIQELMSFVTMMISTQDKLPSVLQGWYESIKGYYQALPGEWVASIDAALIQIADQLVGVAKNIAKWTTDFASSIPKAMFFTVVTIVSTYFMAIDKDKVSIAIGKLIPRRYLKFAIIVKEDVFKAFGGFVKAGAIMYTIVTTMVVLGLMILHVQYALLIGVTIGFFDMLPAIGTGIFLIPWGLFSIISGNLPLGIGLLILYVVVVLIRESSAPKIIGDRIGLHPLVTIMSSYVGLEIMGGIGLIAGPVIAIIVSKMYNAGVIKELYKLVIGEKRDEESVEKSIEDEKLQ